MIKIHTMYTIPPGAGVHSTFIGHLYYSIGQLVSDVDGQELWKFAKLTGLPDVYQFYGYRMVALDDTFQKERYLRL